MTAPSLRCPGSHTAYNEGYVGFYPLEHDEKRNLWVCPFCSRGVRTYTEKKRRYFVEHQWRGKKSEHARPEKRREREWPSFPVDDFPQDDTEDDTVAKERPYKAWGECEHCAFVGDLWFYEAAEGELEGELVGECPECCCITALSTMPEYPSAGDEEKAAGVRS